ncbi:C45 family peptidase [Nonomuraea wenchangensis]|uniref:C45 family peptidase n=1 Tax=Nonomuraea wenchangensis TaxID=568860 RepID=UPI003437F586
MAGMTVIECAGSPLEMGRAHGEQARPVVRRALEARREVTARPGVAGLLTRSGVAGLLTRSPLLGTVRRLMPGLADELRGVAEGAGVPFEDVAAYNWMDEGWWTRRRHLREHGCSVVGGQPAGGPYLAQNMDLPAFMDGSQLVLLLRPQDGPEQQVLTSAGLLALTGVNAAGVAVCVNTLAMLSGDPYGLPVAAVIRGVLASRDRAAAVTCPICVPGAPEWPTRTFGSVVYELGPAPRTRIRPGLPGRAQWLEPGWR